MAVVVIIANGDSVSIAPTEPRQASNSGDVFERSIALVPEQPVALHRRFRQRFFWQHASLHDIDVEPAVSVVIDQAHAAAHRLGKPAEW